MSLFRGSSARWAARRALKGLCPKDKFNDKLLVAQTNSPASQNEPSGF
jgi:hypothetical protein